MNVELIVGQEVYVYESEEAAQKAFCALCDILEEVSDERR